MGNSLESKKKTVELKSKIREFVFGIQDALISTVGLLAGVYQATQNQQVVIISGFAAAFTGALSMATGSYLSSKAQKEIFEKELRDQQEFVQNEPHRAQEGLLEALAEEGLSRENAYRVVRVFAKQKSVFIRTFQEKVLGIGSANLENPFRGAVVMYLSFMMGAFIPILPYVFLKGQFAFLASVAAAGSSLFLVGAFKNYLARKSISRGGFEFLVVALGSAALGWAIGSFFD
ncbi:MAG: VIT1/CCC1 transporter family protein [Candidatus Omnitrophica bacterium]|nr:VIT1/CCC1 transporter family protein [Candidatus Omnitrophota bacterium]